MIGLDILAIVFSATEDEVVLAALEAAVGHDDHAAALLVELLPRSVYVGSSLVVPEIWPEIVARLQSDFAAERLRLENRCAACAPPIEVRTLKATLEDVAAAASEAARYADLVVMRRPDFAHWQSYRANVFEAVLFGSGRPVLVVPPHWETGALANHVVIGWAPRREAARALHDALPFLVRAERITILSVTSRGEHEDEGPHAAADAAAHLARKGIRATVLTVHARGGDEGEVLLREACAIGGDLLVIGGYGKSRIREFVLGGVTRTLTQTSLLPVLLSH
ncbi:MAG: universal stress protein [Alphaproteobacteria bacterium]|nr:universal stress protein [Alphaproteobacteria bacterium]